MIYLFSKTTHPDVKHIPILNTTFYNPNIVFEKYDAIVITSKQAVLALEKISTQWRSKKVLSIGKMSEELVSKYGVELLERGDGYGDSLLDAIVDNYTTLNWLYPRPKVVASDFYVRAKEMGVNIEDCIVYETTCNELCSDIKVQKEDILIFTSPFTIECFSKYYTFYEGQKVVSIGKTTSKSLPLYVKLYEAEETTVDACVKMATSL